MSEKPVTLHDGNHDLRDDEEEKNGNVSECQWMEIRLQGKLPERRSNHSSFVYEGNGHRSYYIHGGRDLKEGALENMWRLDLNDLEKLMADPYHPAQWELISFKGTGPSKISHHTCSVSGEKMILVGGLQGDQSNKSVFIFDVVTHTWSQVASQTGDVPLPRDDHSLSVWGSDYVICGGFVSGSRVNDVYHLQFNPAARTAGWALLYTDNKTPLPRNSHTSVINGDTLYIMGGQDDENNKLDDLWELNLGSRQMKQIQYNQPEGYSVGRSGHTAVTYNNKMYIFGGILEVTKELNDLLQYDYATQTFSIIDQNGDGEYGYHSRFEETNNLNAPLKNISHHDSSSPNQRARRQNQSPSKKQSHTNTSPHKKVTPQSDKNKDKNGQKEEQKGLSSPTSISMYNSFIIKNADESFDQYYHSMKKRKHGNNTVMEQSMIGGGQEAKFGVVRGKKPTPRDGHTANVDSNGYMYVFGGDRHHMPFNDLYMIKLPRN